MGNICPKLTEEFNNPSPQKNHTILRTYDDESEAPLSQRESILFDNDPIIPKESRKFLKSKIYKREFLVECIQENSMMNMFDSTVKILNSVDQADFSQILDKNVEKNNLGLFLKIDNFTHKCYTSADLPFPAKDLVYFGIFQEEILRKKIEPKIKKMKILAFFEIENMQFFLYKLVLHDLMMLSEREIVFIKGIKKISKNEFFEIWKSIPLEAQELPLHQLAEIQFGYAEYVQDEENGITKYRCYTEFNPKIEIGIGILKPIYAEIRRNYLRKNCEELKKILDEEKNNWEYKMSTLDRIYR